MNSGNVTPSGPPPAIPRTALRKLSATAKGALLSFNEDPNSPTLFGLRGAFGDSREEQAAFIALKKRDDDDTLSAEILPSAGKRHVMRADYPVLDHGTDWMLRVSPDAWEPGLTAPGLAEAGSLLAIDGDERLSILVHNYNTEMYQLDLGTWMLRPFSGRQCFRARRWSLAVTAGASVSVVTWSLPNVDAEVE